MTAMVPGDRFVASVAAEGRLAAWRRHGFFLAVLVAFVLVIFARDVATLTALWWTNTTFGHCLFIGPVIGWLIWLRRFELATIHPVGWLPGSAIVAAGALTWLVGDAASVALARQLGLVVILQGCVVSVLGPNIARAVLFPLCYAFFLVPFGQSIEAPLQSVTVGITMHLLAWVGVPAHVDGVLITIANGYFEIAEACSGSKFVIAMLAFAILVANVCFVGWPRRIMFVVMAIAVAIFANGMRAFATIYTASLTSVQAATGFDHIVFGWVFFGLIMAAVLAIGWRWFDRDPDAAWLDPTAFGRKPRLALDALLSAALSLAIIVSAPAFANHIDARGDVLPARIDLPSVAGWHRVALSSRAPWSPNYPAADHFLMGRYANASGAVVDLAIAVYASQHEHKELVSFGVGALRENDRWIRVRDLEPIAGGKVMEITAPGPVGRIVVTWYRIGNVLTANDRRVKLETLRARLFGGRQRAVALLVSAETGAGANPRAEIAKFLNAAGPVDQLADKVAGTPR